MSAPTPVPVPPPPDPANKPKPLTPAVKPVTLTIDAHQVLDATLAQLEAQGAKLLSEAIKEAIPLLVKTVDPLLQKYLDQLKAELPDLIKTAVHSIKLFEKAPQGSDS
jgi:hypothetical protein